MAQQFDVNKAFEKYAQKNAQLTTDVVLLETQVDQLLELVREQEEKLKQYEANEEAPEEVEAELVDKAQLKAVPKKAKTKSKK